MTHDLKRLGIALVAIFLTIAAMTPTAQAEFDWTSGTTTLTIEQDPTNRSQVFEFTFSSLAITCDTVKGQAAVSGSFALAVATKEVTYTDSLKEADRCRGPFGTSPLIKMNGCQYVLRSGTTLGEVSAGQTEGTVDISCPKEKEITVEMPGCIVHVPAQAALGPVFFRTIKLGTKEEVTVEAAVGSGGVHNNGITFKHAGFLCGTSSGENGVYSGKSVIRGRDFSGNQTDVTIA